MTRYWFFSEGQFLSSYYPSIIKEHLEKFQLCFSEEELNKIGVETESLRHFLNLLSDPDYNKEFFIGINFQKRLKLFTLSEMLFNLDLPANHVRRLLENNEATLDELNSFFLAEKNQNLCPEQIREHMQKFKFTILVPMLILENVPKMLRQHEGGTSSEDEEAIPFPPMPISRV